MKSICDVIDDLTNYFKKIDEMGMDGADYVTAAFSSNPADSPFGGYVRISIYNGQTQLCEHYARFEKVVTEWK